jgi:hypothetical protein
MLKSKSKNSKKNKIGNRKAGSRTEMISHPPPIPSFNVVHSTRLRFVLNAAFTGQITYQNLLDCILFSTSATVLFDLFFAVKVRQIEVWAINALGTSTSVTVAFDGTVVGLVGNQVTHTDTSMGIEPAHLRVSPAKKSLASMFQLNSTNAAFALNLPSGCVIDVSLSYKGSTATQAVSAQNVGAALTTGAIYYRGLDGVAVAASKFTPPIGISTA